MNEKVFAMSRAKLSGRIISMAWVIEIIAASVGLFLALSRMIGPTGTEELPLFLAIQGALPFFAVAVIEITKIPLASVFYFVETFRWKCVFFGALLLAMGITFETFFIGFDMYQSILVRELRPTLNSIAEQKRIIRTTSDDKSSSEGILSRRDNSIEASRQNESSINSKFDQQEEELKRQKNEIYKKYEAKTGPLQTSLKAIDSDLIALEKRYQSAVNQVTSARGKATDAALADSDSSKARDQQSVNSLRDERQSIISEATKRRNQVIEGSKGELESCFISCTTIRENRDAEIARIDADERRKLASVDSQIRQIQTRLSGAGVDTSAVRDQFSVELNQLKTEFESDKRALEQKRDKTLEQLAIASGSISGSDKRKIEEIEQRLSTISNERQAELAAEKSRFDAQQQAFDQ